MKAKICIISKKTKAAVWKKFSKFDQLQRIGRRPNAEHNELNCKDFNIKIVGGGVAVLFSYV